MALDRLWLKSSSYWESQRKYCERQARTRGGEWHCLLWIDLLFTYALRSMFFIAWYMLFHSWMTWTINYLKIVVWELRTRKKNAHQIFQTVLMIPLVLYCVYSGAFIIILHFIYVFIRFPCPRSWRIWSCSSWWKFYLLESWTCQG